MAARAKAAAGDKPSRARKKATGANGIDLAELRDHLDALHSEHDEMDEAAAAHRGTIGRLYEKACDKLDVSKDAMKFLFKEERRKRKEEAKAAAMDTRARDSLEKLAGAMGDSPMGVWASAMAKKAGTAQESAE